MIQLETANGIIHSRETVHQKINLGSGETVQVESRVLANIPSTLALCQLCMNQGFAFSCTAGKLPLLITPSGTVLEIPLNHFVPTLESVESLPTEQAVLRVQELIQHMTSPAIPTLPGVAVQHTSIEQQYEMFRSLNMPDQSFAPRRILTLESAP